jgi:hypothetical protein
MQKHNTSRAHCAICAISYEQLIAKVHEIHLLARTVSKLGPRGQRPALQTTLHVGSSYVELWSGWRFLRRKISCVEQPLQLCRMSPAAPTMTLRIYIRTYDGSKAQTAVKTVNKSLPLLQTHTRPSTFPEAKKHNDLRPGSAIRSPHLRPQAHSLVGGIFMACNLLSEANKPWR